MNDIQTHSHDGVNSKQIKPYDVIPTYIMTPTQLTTYLSRNAIEGEEFNVYDGTDYAKYYRINGTWQTVGGGSGTMTQTKGTSLPTASANTDKYYYLTTTDTLYRSNGTAWIALN